MFVYRYVEFDAYTGSKISSIDIGAPVVRMSYSPTSGHAVVAILEVTLLCFSLIHMMYKSFESLSISMYLVV